MSTAEVWLIILLTWVICGAGVVWTMAGIASFCRKTVDREDSFL